MPLSRNKKAITSALSVDKNNALVSSKDLYIEAPEIYLNNGLLQIKEEVSIMGVFGIVIGNSYSTFNIPCMYKLGDDRTMDIVTKDDGKYYRFNFKKGKSILKSMTVLKENTLVYDLINMFWFSGKVPWYMSDVNIAKTMFKAANYASLSISDNFSILEILSSLSTRVKGKTSIFGRTLHGTEEEVHNRIEHVPIGNVDYLASNVNKLIGNYQDKGVQSILVSDPNDPTSIEEALR